MTDLATLTVRLEAEIGKYQENLDKATRQLRKFSDDQNSLLSKAAGAFAAFFTIGKLEEWGKAVLDNADHLAKFSQSTGIAVDELSRLQYGMKASGADAAQLDKVFNKLNDSISDAAGNAKSASGVAFKQMGIDVRTATGALKSADVVIKEVADKFQGYEDGANKSALATALLGKAGDTLIPFLNQGSEGIKALADESDRLGATLDEKTAKAAEAFNDKLGRLKTTLIEGLGNRIAKEMLPVLNNLGEAFEKDGQGAERLDAASRVAATGLRLLVDAGIIVGNVVTAIGKVLGGVAAAIVQVFEGNFSEAGDILQETYGDLKDQTHDTFTELKATWKDGTDDILDEVQVHAQKMKIEAPNLAGGIALTAAADKSIAKLKEMAQTLTDQVATFGLGAAATIEYRLATGDLSDEVAKAGKEGRAYAATIEATAAALEKLKNTKEIEEALAGVNAQILALQGNTAEAAIAEFDRKNAELVTKLRHEGNEEGQKQLDLLLTLIVAQADFNELNQKAAAIQSDLAAAEERLRDSREAGALTEIQYQKELSELRVKAADDLAGIAKQEEAIAKQTGSPEQLEGAKRLEEGIAGIRAQTDLLEKSIRNDAQGAFSEFLGSAVRDIKNVGDAFGKLLENIANQLLDLATQQLGQSIFSGLFGSTSSGGGGGGFFGNIFGAIAGAFGGGAADGKDNVIPGLAYRINEKTAKSEMFVARQPGSIVPDGGGGMTIVNHFNIQAPKGTVSRQTEQQISAAAARGLGSSSRRNN